jgi:hypothetical protein
MYYLSFSSTIVTIVILYRRDHKTQKDSLHHSMQSATKRQNMKS